MCPKCHSVNVYVTEGTPVVGESGVEQESVKMICADCGHCWDAIVSARAKRKA